MIKGLFSSDPGIHVISEHFLNEVLGLSRYVFELIAHGVLTRLHILDDLLVIIPVEGRSPTEQDVQYHSDAPHIALLIILAIQHLGSNVVGSPICLGHLLLRVELLRGSEVDYLYHAVVLGIHENILRFQVSMADIQGVTVGHCRKHLFYYDSCILLTEGSALGDFFEEFSSCAQLRDQVVPLLVLEDLVEADNVGVVELSQDLNLRKETDFLLRVQLVLLYYLHCSNCVRHSVLAFPHFSKSTYTRNKLLQCYLPRALTQ
jgi:hypothetical protein